MSRLSNGAGGFLLVLTVLNILNLADRSLIVAFSNSIIPELGLTHLQYGLLTGFVFTAVYTVLGLFAGSLADRMNRPRLIAAGLALWSAMTAATGLARGFVQMAAARMLIGVGEACLTPAALSMLADRFAPGRRAFASGVYYLGLPLGIGGSFLFAAAAGPALGWRGSFVLLGVLGVAAALLVFFFMRDPVRGAMDGAAAAVKPSTSFGETFRGIGHELRTNAPFTLTLLGSSIALFAQGAAVLDLVWWVRERGYTAVEAQQQSGLIFLLGGIVGAIAGGLGADWAQRRFAAGRLWFLTALCLAAIPMALVYRLVPGHSAAFYGMALMGAVLSMGIYGPAVTAMQELVPPQHRASAVAMFILGGALVGAGGGNAAVGGFADYFTAAGTSEPLTIALLASQSFGLISIPMFYFAARLHLRRREVPISGAAAITA